MTINFFNQHNYWNNLDNVTYYGFTSVDYYDISKKNVDKDSKEVKINIKKDLKIGDIFGFDGRIKVQAEFKSDDKIIKEN